MTHQASASPVARTELAAARAALGLSQELLAHRAGLSLATVARAEAGRATPTRGTQRLLAIALGVPVERLFPENGEAAASSATAPQAVAGPGGDHDAG